MVSPNIKKKMTSKMIIVLKALLQKYISGLWNWLFCDIYLLHIKTNKIFINRNRLNNSRKRQQEASNSSVAQACNRRPTVRLHKPARGV